MRISTNRIELEMARTGMTFSRLEKAAGISHNGLFKIRRDKKCTPVTAGKIANALGVSVERIIEEQERG